MTRREEVIIIGAGLSGLVLAQVLLAHDIPFHIYEKRIDGNVKEGHRFRVSTSTIDALKDTLSTQLREDFERTINEPNEFKPRYVDAHTIDLDEPIAEGNRTSIPVDRTWIVSLLKKRLEGSIAYGKTFSKCDISKDHVNVHFEDGTSVIGSCLEGADGVHSQVRSQLQPNRRLLDFEKAIIWGRIPLSLEIRSIIGNEDVFSWLMVQDHERNIQCVFEPIVWKENSLLANGNYVYFALAKDATVVEYASEEEDCKRHIEEATQSWHSTWRLLLSKTDIRYTRYAQVLSSKPDLELHTFASDTNRIFIIGDAAHPMSPMGGAGATSAINTALDLASLLASDKLDRESVQAHRGRVQEMASANIEHSFQGGTKFWKGKDWREHREAEV